MRWLEEGGDGEGLYLIKECEFLGFLQRSVCRSRLLSGIRVIADRVLAGPHMLCFRCPFSNSGSDVLFYILCSLIRSFVFGLQLELS